MTALTPRQAECFSFIGAYSLEHGYAPTFDEIAAHLGLAKRSGVSRIVDELEARGLIRRQPKLARSLEIVEQHGAGFHLKRILNAVSETGFIRADDPIVAEARACAWEVA